jgi:hypothetical protein
MLSASAPSKSPGDHFTIPKKFAGLILSVRQRLMMRHSRAATKSKSRQRKIEQEGGSDRDLYDCFRDQCWNRVTMLDGEPRRSRHSLAATPKRHCTR